MVGRWEALKCWTPAGLGRSSALVAALLSLRHAQPCRLVFPQLLPGLALYRGLYEMGHYSYLAATQVGTKRVPSPFPDWGAAQHLLTLQTAICLRLLFSNSGHHGHDLGPAGR